MPRSRRSVSKRALVLNPIIGERPELLWVRLSSLNVDEVYQRSLESENSVSLIRSIAANWNWKLCQPLSVARRTDGSLWIVDGQHRHAAASLREDVPGLPCVIQPYEEVVEEAAAFVALNKHRRPLNAMDIFKASLAAGDKETTAIMQLITNAGLSLAKHQNYFVWSPGQIFCVPTIRSAYKRYGPKVCEQGLNALGEAFRGQVLQNSGAILGALFAVYHSHAFNPTFRNKVFVHRLSLNTQSEWMRKCRMEMVKQELGLRVALITVINNAYKQALEDAR